MADPHVDQLKLKEWFTESVFSDILSSKYVSQYPLMLPKEKDIQMIRKEEEVPRLFKAVVWRLSSQAPVSQLNFMEELFSFENQCLLG